MDYKKQQEDLEFGFRSEKDTHEYLESVFGKLMNTKDNREMGNYFEFDKYNDDISHAPQAMSSNAKCERELEA